MPLFGSFFHLDDFTNLICNMSSQKLELCPINTTYRTVNYFGRDKGSR